MSRTPSDATLLRDAKRDLNETRAYLRDARRQCEAYRIRAMQAEQECAEWKERFDLLLERTPEVKP
jgi:FtsZ-binding cell division protein ZapB